MIGGSLFTGIAGLDMGLELAGAVDSWAWQCEKDPHALAVLAQRFPAIRRYTDVREIDAHAQRPDIICGGFPCQDISYAGAGAGIDGARSGLWAEYARVVRVLRPSVVFVENVAALAGRGLDRVLGDLAACGFDAEWDCFRACEVGAPHIRERIFILAYTRGVEWDKWTAFASVGSAAREPDRRGVREPGRHGSLADADGEGRQGLSGRESSGPRRPELAQHGATGVADTDGGGQRPGVGDLRPGESDADRSGEGMLAAADRSGCEGERGGGVPNGERAARGNDTDRRHRAHRFPPGPTGIAGWDGPKPAIRRGDDGVPGRSHRLRLLGNSVVQQQAALAWQTLIARAAA